MSDQPNHRFPPAKSPAGVDLTDKSNGALKATSSAETSERRISEQRDCEAYRKWVSYRKWEARQKWESRVSTQPTDRSPPVASIYTWQGYKSWANKVRRTWKVREPFDT